MKAKVYTLYKKYNEIFLKALLWVLFFIYFLLIVTPTSLQNQILFFATTFLISIILFKKKNEYVKLFFIFTAILVSSKYMYWRTTTTLDTEGFWNTVLAYTLYFAEVYSFIIYILGAFIALRLLERKRIDITKFKKEELPTVDVFIPTYNEPVEIVMATATAASIMDYPQDKFKVYILDDGGTEQKLNDPDPVKREENRKRAQKLKEFAEKSGRNIYYLTRKENKHAKAGNINEALKKTNGDLILILDCDHVPTQDFLRDTVGFFIKYPKAFLVQTPHSFYNPDPIEKNLQIFRQVPNESDMFYKFIQKGLDFWSASFFCGSAAVLRRKYLEEVGGIVGETITEDAETALELHSRGYDSAYYGKQMVYGLQPETFSAFITQRSRWAQGMIQIFLLKNPLFKKGLKWYQKLGYLNANIFWFFGIARTVFLIIPLTYLLFGAQIYNATLEEVLAYAMPHFIFSVILSNYLYAKVRWNFFSELYEALQSLFLLPAIISVFLNPRKPTFKVTPKGENIEQDFVSPFYKPIYILFNITALSFLFAIYRYVNYPDELGTIIVVVFWQMLNFLILALGIIAVREKAERRKAFRIPAKDDAMVFVGDMTFTGKVRDISLTGIWIETHQDLTPYLDKIRDKEIKFSIFDLRGFTFNVKGKVVNANSKNIRMRFLYSTENINIYRKIIEITYAQSTRWKYFSVLEEKTAIEALIFLTKITFKEFKEAYVMTTKEFFKDLQGAIINIYRSFIGLGNKLKEKGYEFIWKEKEAN